MGDRVHFGGLSSFFFFRVTKFVEYLGVLDFVVLLLLSRFEKLEYQQSFTITEAKKERITKHAVHHVQVK